MPWVYILQCGDSSLYTGITTDLERRLAQHRAGKASRYTRARLPVTLMWRFEVETWGLALREERRLKRLTRRAKQTLIAQAASKDIERVKGE